MAAFTVPEIIEIAELSVALSTADVLKGKLYSPRLAPDLPIKIYIEKECVKWAYNQTPTYDDIQFTANYLYDLCGLYAIRARNIINGSGGGIPITPVTPNPPTDCTGVVYITAADFEADGVTVFDADWANKVLKIFWNNIPKFIKEPTEWVYVLGGGFRITIPGFNAKTVNTDAEFYVFVGCFNPGSIINPYQTPINTPYFVTGVDDYDLIRTPFLLSAYGNVRFQVSQKDENGDYQATGIQPTYNEADDPLVYHFTGLGGLDTEIVAF